MHAREELSRVGEYRLELLSLKNDINLDQILGKNVTVKLALQDDETRYFNGFVTRFSQGGTHGRYRRYYATVQPWLWFLSRTADCRIFQEMTVPEIVKKMFADHPTASFKDELDRHLPQVDLLRAVPRDRLELRLPAAGAGRHLLLLHARRREAHAGDGRLLQRATRRFRGSPIPFIAPDASRAARHRAHQRWTPDARDPARRLRRTTTTISSGRASSCGRRRRSSRGYSPSTYEVYDYPGEYLQKADGEATAAVRIDEFARAVRDRARAATNAKTMQRRVAVHAREAARAPIRTASTWWSSATYDLEFSDYEAMPDRGGAEYRCSFVAMSSKQQFRPRRLTPKPFVQGPQTAVVVGPAGDEIYTDKYGRVKVQFHWDREGEKNKDENCSAGSACHSRGRARRGAAWPSRASARRSIVDFLEGDPDQPIITGRVYNAEQMPPYALPANMTQIGHQEPQHQGRQARTTSTRSGSRT